jgi:hypothetical protein
LQESFPKPFKELYIGKFLCYRYLLGFVSKT